MVAAMIAAQHGCKMLKTVTKQAFSNGYIGDGRIDSCLPDQPKPSRLPP
jgi:hypothetical protein